MKLKCKKCKKEWEYKGNNKYFATCPDCLRKVDIIGNQSIADKVRK